jgi:mannose-6-phosphate isomerase-like protein (cupin superfamily)
MDGEPPRATEIRSLPGLGFREIWATDATPVVPIGGEDPTVAMTNFVAPPGGTRFRLCYFPPDADIGRMMQRGEVDLAQVGAELGAAMPDLAVAMERDNPGMHTTDTIDYDIVLAGEIWCELDDGVEVHLKAGDCLVQCGTRHAWRNKGTETCVLAAIMVGAARA